LITLLVGAWLVAGLLSWLARRRQRREQAWLRSEVPTRVAYARLRAEIDRKTMDSQR
jgi:hypothetical protein